MKTKILLLSVLILVVGLPACVKTTVSDRPNIVLIISDDQSWPDYSFLGHEHIETPRIDQLAAEGLTFTRGYTAAPLCRPALASMATGLFPHQHKVVGNDPVFDFGTSKRYGEEWMKIRAEMNERVVDGFEQLPTLADILGEAGYVSLQTGKWWEGNPSRGGFTEGMTHGDPVRGGRHGDEGLRIGREGLDEIYRFIEDARGQEKPFYVWYAPFLPHAPHTPPDSLRDKYLPFAASEAVANYWAMCDLFDITCGQLMDYIEAEGLSENTLFVYVTDNGWIQDPDRPNRFDAMSKTTPYEMGIRTPMMFRWKGVITPEMDNENLVSSIDIATTILDICGLEAEPEMQGINVLDKKALSGRDAIFAEAFAHDFTSVDESLNFRIIVKLPWKLILPDAVNRPYNPQFYPIEPDGKPQLYNLLEDPHEQVNLAAENPEVVSSLTREIEKWWNK
ncbi:MAG: sulfatase [Bacteroidales bacterium]|nr:sulfatase [Bacteroidales bacterium]